MANPGMDPVHITEYHITNMLQWSHLLISTDTPLSTPHPASCLINYCVRAEGSQIGDGMVIDQSDPDHTRVIMDQLRTLADH